MKRSSIRSVMLAVVLTLVLAGSAFGAAWTDMHGASGQVVYPGNVTSFMQAPPYLYFIQKPSLPNYVQFQVPVSDGARKVSRIWVQYKRTSTSGRIAAVSIYDGMTFKKTVAITTSPAVGAVANYNISLGTTPILITFGLGVTLHVTNSTAATGLYIGSVGAYLAP